MKDILKLQQHCTVRSSFQLSLNILKDLLISRLFVSNVYFWFAISPSYDIFALAYDLLPSLAQWGIFGGQKGVTSFCHSTPIKMHLSCVT